MVSWEGTPELASATAGLLGERDATLASIEEWLQVLDAQTLDAGTVEIVPVPMDRDRAERWRHLAAMSSDDWAFVSRSDGSVIAVDEPSELGLDAPEAAVTYPTLHTRLGAWWLFHAWRSVDLTYDSLSSLRSWRLNSSAVATRALIETTGCLLHEARGMADAWSKCKQAGQTDPLERSNDVHNALGPLLARAAFGSRARVAEGRMPATNVLTYVQKLSKATSDGRFEEWYDWLSDAGHPAWGARIAMGSDPHVHESQAVMLRFYARSPLTLTDGKSRTRYEYPIFERIADSLIGCVAVLEPVLSQALQLVDDFGLTTAAAAYTRRSYWRDFTPVKGNRDCPCGCGKWNASGHRWGSLGPVVTVPATHSV